MAEPRLDDMLTAESPISYIPAADDNSNSLLLQQDLQLSEGEEVDDDDVFDRGPTGATDFSQLHQESQLKSTRPKNTDRSSLPKLEREVLHEELEEGELIEEGTSATASGMAPREYEEDDDDDEESKAASQWTTNIAEMLDRSDMNRTGRLHTDLAMSDSSGSDQDDEDEDDRGAGPSAAKRARTVSGDDCDFGTF